MIAILVLVMFTLMVVATLVRNFDGSTDQTSSYFSQMDDIIIA